MVIVIPGTVQIKSDTIASDMYPVSPEQIAFFGPVTCDQICSKSVNVCQKYVPYVGTLHKSRNVTMSTEDDEERNSCVTKPCRIKSAKVKIEPTVSTRSERDRIL